MGTLQDQILDYFEETFPGAYEVEDNAVTQSVGDDDQLTTTVAWFDDAPASVSIYVHMNGIEVPEHNRGEAAVLSNHLNLQAIVGHFRVDPDDGAVVAHHSFFVSDAALTPAQMAANYATVVNQALHAVEAFAAVAAGSSGSEAYVAWERDQG